MTTEDERQVRTVTLPDGRTVKRLVRVVPSSKVPETAQVDRVHTGRVRVMPGPLRRPKRHP